MVRYSNFNFNLINKVNLSHMLIFLLIFPGDWFFTLMETRKATPVDIFHCTWQSITPIIIVIIIGVFMSISNFLCRTRTRISTCPLKVRSSVFYRSPRVDGYFKLIFLV
ncbi:hypothetical protein WN944_006485 [Citrus x changshan-huyou]|uniref:Uncharacterized protein n=1 Tax=Citrus x changshan-huyou TaxID=2935761 RepID=A0AAP0MLR8_9ROSI